MEEERAHQQKEEEDRIDFEQKNLWRCYGKIVDRRLISYIVQVTITLIVLGFCMYQIARKTTEDTTVWISILSAIAGNFMPNGLNHNINSDK
jgi:hypothetical protein